jgi:hypothetical protein
LLELGLILLLAGPNCGDDVEQGFSHPNDVRKSRRPGGDIVIEFAETFTIGRNARDDA